jgi:hypothetical protein
MPQGNNPFSVGKSLNVGIYDLQFTQHADDLVAKAESEGKVLSIIQYKGRDVLRVSNKSNPLVEGLRHLTGFYTRNARSIQNYRASLPSYVEPRHQELAESFARAVLDNADTGIQRHQASHPTPKAAEQSASIEASPQAVNGNPRIASNAIEIEAQDKAIQVIVPIEQSRPQHAVPKLSELISWYQTKNDRYPEAITPGFEAEKFGEFIAFTNQKVKSEMIEADGGSNYRPAGRKYEKVHLSLNREQFGRAYDQLAPILFSDKNPFLQFKISALVDDDVLKAARDKVQARAYGAEDTQAHLGDLGRVSEGLQITFYYTPPGTSTPKERLAKEAQDSAQFLKTITGLSQSFATGRVYGRTMQLNPYIDYRDEAWSRGDTNKPVQEALRDSPYNERDRARLAGSPFFSALEKVFLQV